MVDYWKCPNTGRILASFKDDNKAICICRTRNPNLPNEKSREVFPGGATLHFKFGMQPATEEEWITQTQAEFQAQKVLANIGRG